MLFLFYVQGVNGSGKHNNWSIATDDGTNLLNVKQLQARTGESFFLRFVYTLGIICVGIFVLNQHFQKLPLPSNSITTTTTTTANSEIFPVIMAALVKAVYQHGDLMRMAVATPGNDFRLGACEAPPALVSTHLGDDMTAFLEGYISKSCVLGVLIFTCTR